MKMPLLISILPACTSDSQSTQREEVGGIPQEATSPKGMAIIRTSQISRTRTKGFKSNIEQDTRANRNFRKVVYTGQHMQLVLMSLKPGEEIGSETHSGHDQFFRFEGGTGRCVINGTTYEVGDGDVVIAPAGSLHNVIKTKSSKPLQLYTIYAPPQHEDGILRATRQEASRDEPKFNGKTTE